MPSSAQGKPRAVSRPRKTHTGAGGLRRTKHGHLRTITEAGQVTRRARSRECECDIAIAPQPCFFALTTNTALDHRTNRGRSQSPPSDSGRRTRHAGRINFRFAFAATLGVAEFKAWRRWRRLDLRERVPDERVHLHIPTHKARPNTRRTRPGTPLKPTTFDDRTRESSGPPGWTSVARARAAPLPPGPRRARLAHARSQLVDADALAHGESQRAGRRAREPRAAVLVVGEQVAPVPAHAHTSNAVAGGESVASRCVA